MKYCVNCGEPLEDDDLFCTDCGAKQPEAVEADGAAEVGPQSVVAKVQETAAKEPVAASHDAEKTLPAVSGAHAVVPNNTVSIDHDAAVTDDDGVVIGKAEQFVCKPPMEVTVAGSRIDPMLSVTDDAMHLKDMGENSFSTGHYHIYFIENADGYTVSSDCESFDRHGLDLYYSFDHVDVSSRTKERYLNKNEKEFNEFIAKLSDRCENSAVIVGLNVNDSSTVKRIAVPEAIGAMSIVGIANKAFQSLSALESITLPDTIVAIGDKAFDLCSSLKSINLPKSLSRIGKAAFLGCSALPPEAKSALKKAGYKGKF